MLKSFSRHSSPIAIAIAVVNGLNRKVLYASAMPPHTTWVCTDVLVAMGCVQSLCLRGGDGKDGWARMQLFFFFRQSVLDCPGLV